MAKGSQLTQLKSALSKAGITGQPQNTKKRKRSAPPEKDKAKKAAKLEEIHKRLNPFDTKVTKLKHDVGGRKIKGVVGKPAVSKQAGIEQRKKTLLKEWSEKGRAGGILDQRFGENNPNMSLEERMLERFTRERQRASKGTSFNLEDEDELTHYGQSLSKLDDFDDVNLRLDSEEEEESGQIGRDIVRKTHFGGFSDDEQDEESEEPARKKTKAEVMAEVIAKSKEHKLRRQMEKENEENIRHELDEEFSAIRDLLYAPDPSAKVEDLTPTGERPEGGESSAPVSKPITELQDVNYDQQVRELAFDKRSKPKDRTRTEEELALEEKEALEKAEKQRRKRMLGLPESESEDEGKSRGKRKRGGDDLEDDFYDEDVGLGALGTGLGEEDAALEESLSALGSEGSEESGEGTESENGEDSEGEEEASNGESGEEWESDGDPGNTHEDLSRPSKATRAKQKDAKAKPPIKELPYTFPCPATHDEFLEIIEQVEDKDIPIVIKRIRALFHTSLAPENKFKLQTFMGILIDHILYITAPPRPRFPLVSEVMPHLLALVKAYPVQAAEHFNEKLLLMHKNLKRGLSQGALDPEAKTWPGLAELTLLRIIGTIWSTSDLNHAVVSPTRVLMGSYLGLGRVRSLRDIASGLFICTLFLQFEALSKRLVPEVVNFLANTVLHLAPHEYEDISLPGSFPSPDFRSELCRPLRIKTHKVKSAVVRKANLTDLLTAEGPTEQAKLDLLGLALTLIPRFADMYKGLEGFIELYDPILEVLNSVREVIPALESQLSDAKDVIGRLIKFAGQGRQPLRLQAHKPIPIPTYIPKFESTSSSYIRNQDPDRERNEAAKLRAQYKKERKGAIRELRKDARFLAAVELEKQKEKDAVYRERMNKVFGSLEAPPHSSLPVRGFDQPDGETSPGQLLQYLQTLISQSLDGATRIPGEGKEEWAGLVNGLSNWFLKPLQTPDMITWEALLEKIALVDATLEIIDRVTARIEGMFLAPEDFTQLFVKLVDLSTVLELWVEQGSTDLTTIAPADLQAKALRVTVAVLRSLVFNSSSESPSWQLLRRVLSKALDTLQDCRNRINILTYPMTITMFDETRLHLSTADDTSVELTNYMTIDAPTKLPAVLGILLGIITTVVCPPIPCEGFLADISRRLLVELRATFDLYVSAECHTTTKKRARALLRVIECVQQIYPHYNDPFIPNMIHRLVLYRLKEGLKPGFTSLDKRLVEVLQVFPPNPPSTNNIRIVLDYLQTDSMEDENLRVWDLALTYIRHDLPLADSQTLETICSVLPKLSLPNTDALAVDVKERLQNKNELDDVLHGKDDTKAHPESIQWRQQVLTTLGQLIYPDTIEWMNDDLPLNDEQFADRSLQDTYDRFERPLSEADAQSREALCKKFSEYICLIYRCDGKQCNPSSDKGINPLPSTLQFISLILEGPPEECPALVRRSGYMTLRRMLLHHKASAEHFTSVSEVILRGISDKDRSVRLNAGYALNALIHQAAPRDGARSEQIGAIFASLSQVFDNSIPPIKETSLVIVGHMGRTKNLTVLGHVLYFLVVQLGLHNPVLRSTAFTQMFDVVRYQQQKRAFTVFAPHLEKIAPYVIVRIQSHPTLLTDVCRILTMAPSDFISATLKYTLPPLIAQGELNVVNMLAVQIGVPRSELYLQNSSKILAYIFLQNGDTSTDRGLSNLLKYLDNPDIPFPSIVKSSMSGLLGELVVTLGDEDQRVAQSAVAAMRKVQKMVFPSKELPLLPRLLKESILGIIAALKDMLQDLQYRHVPMMRRKIVRSLGSLVKQIGPDINNVAPQILAIFQTMLNVPDTAEVTLQSWYIFFTTIKASELGAHCGAAIAALVLAWPNFSEPCRDLAQKIMEYLIIEYGESLEHYIDDIVDISHIPELQHVAHHIQNLRGTSDPYTQLQVLLGRLTSDNQTLVLQTLSELKRFMQTEHEDLIRKLASGDVFDPMVSYLLTALLAIACRDGEGMEPLHLSAYECIGILGAVDPDRCEVKINETRIVILHNFSDESESVLFALHLVRDLLVKIFCATSDISYQSFLSYSIQQLLKYCGLTASVVGAEGRKSSLPIKIRNRWNSLPKHVLDTVTPLLGGQFSLSRSTTTPVIQHPVYSHQTTYREWLRTWTTYLIDHASGVTAQELFSYVRPSIWSKDAAVAHHILPHIVLNILISGDFAVVEEIRAEIVAVLADQTNPESTSSYDKKQLSAQAIFMLVDHLNKWTRMSRQFISRNKTEEKHKGAEEGGHLLTEKVYHRVDSILSSIDQSLMAQAALQCKAYARALMAFEHQIILARGQSTQSKELIGYYDRLHEIYANLDEPDGMEGVSTFILSPSLEHQIRQHESTGRWTSAQSCWEVRLQQAPDNVEFHLGLLRCLRNLGHYDTLRTHVRGVLTRHPNWQAALAEYQVESAWMVGAWDDVEHLVGTSTEQSPQIVIARILLAMRTGNDDAVTRQLSEARMTLGSPISAAGPGGYRRSYDAALNLHLTYELEVIHKALIGIANSQATTSTQKREAVGRVTETLAARLQSTLPTFRTREPILSMRRAAFGMSFGSRSIIATEIGRYWLESAKIARKAGQWQTAYSAVLQANQNQSRYTFMESAKLVKFPTGETIRALQELEKAMHHLGLIGDTMLDLTENEQEMNRIRAKAQVLRARWMNESDRYERKTIYEIFREATTLQPDWEGAQYHLGHFHDECYKDLPSADKHKRGLRMNFYTVRAYAKAIKCGSKYVYQTIPRLLTIWLDIGENLDLLKQSSNAELFQKLNETVAKAVQEVSVWKWYTAFAQIVSRVGHANPDVYKLLAKVIIVVLQEYPKQALWLFTSVVKSTKSQRGQRGKQILDQLQNHPRNAKTQIPQLVKESLEMTNQLLALCDHPIVDEKKLKMSMSKDFPRLARLGRSNLIIPLQESLTASLPPSSAAESTHQPFPIDAPTFEEFEDEIDIMKSLAKPRKITIRGSNGQIYMFLGKPKDDLRKDARLMEFNAIINKLLKANSESRRRQLHIRTYGVVTLNEECGFIQWVPNTIPLRPVLHKAYNARRIKTWSSDTQVICTKLKEATEQDVGRIFTEKLLPLFPPVLHEWFIEAFPEATAWLASRLTFSRSAAVMSMVGFILGLGDRHCENILLDQNTGDVVHVDFNCLFEKGKNLETPERVPFRLTQNIIDGFGVTGVEGIFRTACEVTLQLLRDNKDPLMSVLDAFIHDPLVEWEDEKRRLERKNDRNTLRNTSRPIVDLRNLAE
ncbi:hypothetical protein AX16_001904, partial [Volvariella volvacea WC 439]